MELSCPKCKSANVGKYFCLSCGQIVANEVATVPHTSVPPFIEKTELIKNTKFFSKYLLFPLAFIIFSLIAFGLFKLSALFRPQNPKSPAHSVVLNDSVLTSNIDLPIFEFNKEELASLVPSDADFYLEGKNISKFLNAFTTFKLTIPISKTEINIEELPSLVEDDYAIFSKVYESTQSAKVRGWGVVFKSKNDAMLSSLFEKTKESSFSARVIDDYAIVANDDRIFEDVKDSEGKINLNLSLNSKFASAKNELPAEGKLFILLLSDSVQETTDGLSEMPIFNEEFKKLTDELVRKNKSSYVVK